MNYIPICNFRILVDYRIDFRWPRSLKLPSWQKVYPPASLTYAAFKNYSYHRTILDGCEWGKDSTGVASDSEITYANSSSRALKLNFFCGASESSLFWAIGVCFSSLYKPMVQLGQMQQPTPHSTSHGCKRIYLREPPFFSLISCSRSRTGAIFYCLCQGNWHQFHRNAGISSSRQHPWNKDDLPVPVFRNFSL